MHFVEQFLLKIIYLCDEYTERISPQPMYNIKPKTNN